MAVARSADVVVIGAGIIGASCAFHLAREGLAVAVLEAQDAPATGSTGRSAAGVRVQFSSEVNVRLSWESIKEYRRFEELYGESADYRALGYLFLVPPESWGRHLKSLALQRDLGVPVEVLSLPEAQRKVPFAASGIAGTTFGPADGVIDPHRVTHTFLRLARGHGAKVYLSEPVHAGRRHDDYWHLETRDGSIAAPVVVNAAGAWAGAVAKAAALAVPVEPVRRYVFATAPLRRPHAFPLTVDVATGFYLRSEGERVLFGRSNPGERPGFFEGIDWSWLEPTLEAGLRRFPWLEESALDRQASWWGYYETTPDHNAILGRLPGADGWVNACGFSGHGVQQAPAVGRVICEEVCRGRAESIDIDALRLERFGDTAGAGEHHIV